MIDLHTHSTASDGGLSPTQLVERAEKIGLSALALTDHDTVGGIEEAMGAAVGLNVEFIPGIEISAELKGGTLHIVGLFVDHHNEALLRKLEWLVKVRDERNAQMVDLLCRAGKQVTMEELRKIAKEGVLGRPHFAQLLIQKGYISTLDVAFEKYLGIGGLAYVPKKRLQPQEAVELIADAGGVPILAHPEQTRRYGDELDELVRGLVAHGLMGIEVYCTGYSKRQIKRLRRIVEKHNLLLSGGSDFHGLGKSKVRLGYGVSGLNVPDELVEPLKTAALAQKARSLALNL